MAAVFVSRYIPEGLGCSCGPDWYTKCVDRNCESYMWFLLTTCFCIPLTVIIFSYSQLLGALRAVSENLFHKCWDAATS